MSKIKVDIGLLKAAAESFAEFGKDAAGKAETVQFIKNNMRSKLKAERRIRETLQETEEQLNALKEDAALMRQCLYEIAALYEKTEVQCVETLGGTAGGIEDSGLPFGDGSGGGFRGDNPEDPETDPEFKQFLAWLKALLGLSDKTDAYDKGGIFKEGISYLEALYSFWTGDKKGLTGAQDILKLVDKSAGVWTDFYDYLKNFYNGAGNTFSLDNQRIVKGVAIGGDFFGLLSTLCGTVNTIRSSENNTFAGVTGEILGCGDDVIDMIEDIIKLKNIDAAAGTFTKGNGLYSPLSLYTTIVTGYTDAFSQGFKSYDKYSADGAFDSNDAAQTGLDFGVSGLYSMVKSLSFGMISEDTLGVSASDISTGMGNWAENTGKNGGNYILSHPDLYNSYQNADPIGKVFISFYAAFKA